MAPAMLGRACVVGKSMPSALQPVYQRVLLKLSGEALLGTHSHGIDAVALNRVAEEVRGLCDIGIQVALVIGGGNIFRGVGLSKGGMERTTADHIGMLATVMNALALQDSLEHHGMAVRVMSAISINEVCEDYLRRRAIRHLEKGRVVVLAAGTGNPFFTTDSAASLRSIEIEADIMIKATKVNGVFSDDPLTNPDAVRYDRLNYDDVLSQGLQVMDATAVVLCRDHNMPMRVVDMNNPGSCLRVAMGEDEGTLVANLE